MNSEFNYKIMKVDEKIKWIYISSNGSFDEIDAFVSLVKRIANQSNSNIIDIGECRYKIPAFQFDAVFQYDDLFGIVIEYKKSCDKKNILDYLNENIIN